MTKIWKKHVFTAELPYEKDQVVSLFIKERFEKVDDFIMSLGQMSNIPPSRLYSYRNGKLVGEKKFIKNKLKAAGVKLYFFYIPKALISVTIDLIKALKKIEFKCDIYFAQHFLPAYIAIILRKIGVLRCQKIIFWMFDFFLIPPQLSRGLYYRGIDLIQKYIRKNVDEIWYTTPRLAESDRERFGDLPSNVIKRYTHGCFFRRIKTRGSPLIPPLNLAFLGSLRRNNAIYESMDVISYCVGKGMNVKLHVIGSGPEEVRLKEYVRRQKLLRHVNFYGYIDDGEKIAKIFSKCHLGLALYPADPYGPNWYITSGKFRRFISQRLPVITSTVPYFLKYIYDFNAGIIVDNDPEDVYKAVYKIYKNPSNLNKLKIGVDKLYNSYKADKVLEIAFTKMLNDK